MIHIDATGLRPGADTWCRLDHESRAWRAVPGPGRTQMPTGRATRVVPPVHPGPSGAQVAGLAELPSDVVALAAVPDLGARPMRTSPSLPGATRLLVVPIPHRGIIDPSHATRPQKWTDDPAPPQKTTIDPNDANATTGTDRRCQRNHRKRPNDANATTGSDRTTQRNHRRRPNDATQPQKGGPGGEAPPGGVWGLRPQK